MENPDDNPNAHAHLITTFCEITSSSPEEAQFFLESHNFDLDSAVSTFLETTSVAAATVATSTAPTAADLSPSQSLSQSLSPSASPPSSPSHSHSRSRSPSPALRSSLPNNLYNLRSRQPQMPSSNTSGEKASGTRSGTGRIRTLSDLNRRHDDDSGSNDDEPQEYYTGGEKSGMLVQDPTKANDVDAIFNQARQAGALEGPPEPSSSSRSFTGTGRLLSGETLPATPQQPEAITHTITFWSNGFTVDDGPLRRLDDPANASFLESIRNSEFPKELEPADRRTSVHVNLMRKEQDYPVPKKRHTPFQGVGRTLGGTSSPSPAEQNVAATPLTTAPPPSAGLVVDQMQPSTSIQLRLADGTRMVSRFNYHHTIRDIRAFIDSSRPGSPGTYQLQTVGFPPKQLSDLDQTIEQAGLANSVVIQKI